MPLRGVLIEEPDGDLMFNGLVIYGGNRALTVAASSAEEKEKWKTDLQNAIQMARDKSDTKITYLSLKSCSEYFGKNLNVFEWFFYIFILFYNFLFVKIFRLIR